MVTEHAAGAVLIDLQNVRKQYGGANGAPPVTVLHGISLRIRVGEFIAIIGASGSGLSGPPQFRHLPFCRHQCGEARFGCAGHAAA